jgi:hypothetical protein
VIKEEAFKKPGWLSDKITHYWSGENSIYLGRGVYQGLGVVASDTGTLRKKLMKHYNEDLAGVIAKGGKINGVAVTKIQPGPFDADQKIKWVEVKRLKH